MLKIGIFLILAFTGSSLGYVFKLGECPDPAVVSNFNLTRYLGTWYEYARFDNSVQTDTKCNKGEYSLDGDGNVRIVEKSTCSITGDPKEFTGLAKLVEESEGKFIIRYSVPTSTPYYYVLGTDYCNWASVFACYNLKIGIHVELAWVLTRDQHPSSDIIDQAENAFLDQYICIKSLSKTPQEDCFEKS